MISKMLSALTNNCKRGWRYDEGSCFFNTKCIMAFFFSLNLWTILFILFEKGKALSIIHFYSPKESLLYLIPLPLFFILISIFYSKKKTINITVAKAEIRKWIMISYSYFFISMTLMIVVSLARN